MEPFWDDLEKIEDFLVSSGSLPDDRALTVLPPDTPADPWYIELCLSTESEPLKSRPTFREELSDFFHSVLGSEIACIRHNALQQEDWIKKSLEGLPSVRIGRTVIHGQHTRSDVRVGDFPIEIEAAFAFGTGHHETTYGCLEILNYLIKSQNLSWHCHRSGGPWHILDVGTGTGILAMAAAQRNRFSKVIAGDIDPEAIRAARGNAKLNGLENHILFYTGPATRSALVRHMKPFDLIFANVLAAPLRSMARHLEEVLSESGALVLSGLLNREVHSIAAVYKNYGLKLHKIFSYREWTALLLKRACRIEL
jgi:ribosomal protein L11 methyltransferase